MLCGARNFRKDSRCQRPSGHDEETHFDPVTGWQWTDPAPIGDRRDQ